MRIPVILCIIRGRLNHSVRVRLTDVAAFGVLKIISLIASFELYAKNERLFAEMKVVAERIYRATTLTKAVDHETKPGRQCYLLLRTAKVRGCDTAAVCTRPLVAHPELSPAGPGVLCHSTDSLTERVHIDVFYQIDCF